MKTEPKNTKMVNHLSIAGVLKPEKLAEGLCPNCKKAIIVWLTGEGLELSIGQRGDVNKSEKRNNAGD